MHSECRADALLPPRFETVWVGTDGGTVNDPRLASILRRPFRHSRDYGTDFNLHKHRLSALDQLIDPGVWPKVCELARRTSEARVREDATFQQQCEVRTARAERQHEHRLDQLHLRATAGTTATAGFNEIAFEEAVAAALVDGIRNPAFRLDSVTFFAVAGYNPFEYERSRY